MRKRPFKFVIIAGIVSFLLCACGKSEAAVNADNLRQHRINAKNRIIQWVPNKNCE